MENIMENIYIYIIYFDVVNSDRGLYSSDPFIPLIEIKSRSLDNNIMEYFFLI